MPSNDYKPDAQKPPVKSAVLIPFRHALMALARMMQGQIERHKLQGSADPFQEWAQLPDAQNRLAEAQGRHTLFSSADLNPDSGESHALHDLWNALAVVELMERRKAAAVATLGNAGARLCICGHRQDQHDMRPDGKALECVADHFTETCPCPEFREL